MILETERLILRPWQDEDLDGFAAMSADPEVMRHFPRCFNREEARDGIQQFIARVEQNGFSIQPIIRREDQAFLGLAGLNVPRFPVPVPFTPCVEVGWRLRRDAWGQGYASEAARAWLRFGFEILDLNEIVAFTAKTNINSQRLMQRLKMTTDPADDFNHPAADPSSSIYAHVLYRLQRDDFYKYDSRETPI